MYFGLQAWCTRWWDGVFSTHSSGPSRPIARVWIQNSQRVSAAERARRVVLLALVVHDVGGPHRVHPVAGAVEPVVGAVDAQETDDPGPGRRERDLERAVVRPQVDVAGEERGL